MSKTGNWMLTFTHVKHFKCNTPTRWNTLHGNSLTVCVVMCKIQYNHTCLPAYDLFDLAESETHCPLSILSWRHGWDWKSMLSLKCTLGGMKTNSHVYPFTFHAHTLKHIVLLVSSLLLLMTRTWVQNMLTHFHSNSSTCPWRWLWGSKSLSVRGKQRAQLVLQHRLRM